ncbi:MAG: hypothetical protein ABEH43_08545, partial [Flavobacteriales bacterium]
MKPKHLIPILFLFQAFLLNAQEKPNDSLSMKTYYKVKLRQYLQKDTEVDNHYRLTDSSIIMYESLKHKKDKKEFELKWHDVKAFNAFMDTCSPGNCIKIYSSYSIDSIDFNTKSIFSENSNNKETKKLKQKNLKKRNTLKGKKIAIDPGHIAGNPQTAKLEQRYVHFDSIPEKNIHKEISIIEANLNLATARILAKRLRAKNASVMLTRNSKDTSSLGISF